MLKTKRLLLKFMAMGLTLSLLAGCGTQGGGTAPVNSPSDSPKAGTGDKEGEREELKQATLKVLFIGPGKQQDSDRVWEEFNKKLPEYLPNTKVDVSIVPNADYKDKWQLMIAAGEPMDIAWTGWLIPYVEEVGKGAYKPLDELIDTYAPAIKAEIPDWIMEKAKVEGKIYSIPCYQSMAEQGPSMKTQKELADKYLDVEEANKVFASSRYMTKEKYDFIENYLKTLEANGELRKGISPYMAQWLGSNGYEHITGGVFVDVFADEVKAVMGYEIPGVKLNSDTFHDWFEKGYIRKDVVGMKTEDITKEEGKTDGYVVWCHNYSKYADATDSGRWGFDILNISINQYSYLPNSPSSTSLTIPRTSQNPERAMMLMELLNTSKGTDLYNLLIWGIENEHYTKTGEGTIETIGYQSQGTSDAKYGLWKWAMGNTFNAWQTQTDTEGMMDYVKQLHDESIVSPLMGFKLDTSPIKTELAQMSAVNTEYDSIYWMPNYEELRVQQIEKLQKAGAEKVKAEIQRQIDEWLKTK